MAQDPLRPLFPVGRALYSLAIAAIGVETLVCARNTSHALGLQYEVLPVIPWLPAIPWVAYLCGAIWVACGTGLLSQRTMRTGSFGNGHRMGGERRIDARLLAVREIRDWWVL